MSKLFVCHPSCQGSDGVFLKGETRTRQSAAATVLVPQDQHHRVCVENTHLNLASSPPGPEQQKQPPHPSAQAELHLLVLLVDPSSRPLLLLLGGVTLGAQQREETSPRPQFDQVPTPPHVLLPHHRVLCCRFEIYSPSFFFSSTSH